MQYFVGFVSPGSAETIKQWGGKNWTVIWSSVVSKILMSKKWLKSDNYSLSYNRKRMGFFFRTRCI